MSVKGKVILITGAASGIGAACARELAEQGGKVVLTDINAAAGRTIADELTVAGNTALFFSHDVAKESDWQCVMGEIEAQFGRLDVLVNNAGIMLTGNPETTTLEQFHLANAVMADGVFLGCKYAIPVMRKTGGGSIINMSSIASHIGFPNLFAYSAAKGAVRTMTKTIAAYCREQGNNIRCNSIHPGAIDTPMVRDLQRTNPQHETAEFRASPGEVASLVLYLASNESRFMNGAEIVFDNGVLVTV